MAFYVFFFVFALAKSKNVTTSSYPPISIIVCAKNEEQHLHKNVSKILDQDYPHFEVVLINDASTDGTGAIMETFASSHDRIKHITVENNERFWGNKKYALTLGIKKASYDHLLFIDADCYPATSQWIKQMAASFQDDKKLVLGYGGYAREKGSWLNRLIRFETVMTAVQYFSYAICGRPYMGVGRNLAYTSALFYEQKGFINHMDVQSGDDDLFVNEAATANNTAVQFSPESFTISLPKKHFKDWITQKRRHITTSKHYKNTDKALLGIFYLSQFLFLILGVAMLISQFNLHWVAAIILIRYAIAWTSVGASAYKLKEKDVAWFFPFFELFLVITQLSIFIANRFSKPTRWK